MPDEKIADLIERVERLEGPDRETDCLIWAEFGNRDVRWDGNKLIARYRKPPHDECWLGTIDPGRVQRNFSATSGFKPPIPEFTASLDACLALVERVRPGWVPALEFGDPGADSTTMRSHIAKLRPNMRDDIGWQTSGVVRGSSLASMPLAVLSALLRSMQTAHLEEAR